MASYFPLPVTVWLCAAFASAAILYAAAALLTATGKGPTWARSAPLILLLAALLPIGTSALLVLFASQAVTIIAGVSLAAFVRQRGSGVDAMAAGKAADLPGSHMLRFSLGDLLGWLAVAAAVLAILRHTPNEPVWSAYLGGARAVSLIFGLGIALGTATLATSWFAAKSMWLWRRPVISAIAVALAATLFVAIGTPPMATLFLPTAGLIDSRLAWIVLTFAVTFALWLFIAARFRSSDIAHTSTVAACRGDGGWRATSFVISAFLLASLGDVYRALLPPPVPPPAVLPNPNAFDRLTSLGNSFNWSAIPTQDVEAASEAACRQFLQDNSAAFAKLREDLQVPSQVPLTYDANYMAAYLPAIQSHRTLARAIYGRSRAFRAQGQFSQATESWLDLIRMAYAMEHGGVSLHDSIATAFVDLSRQQLILDLPKLDVDEFERFQRELETLQKVREPLIEIETRHFTWSRLTQGWIGRLELWNADRIAVGHLTLQYLSHFRQRTDARLQLLIAEAAVRRYRLTTGKLPDNLATLVPEYLAEVPGDPFSEGPLVYRRTGDDYLLYSVWINGRDDGGARAETVARSGDIDYFFDSEEN